jgi:delta-aminolevulinic acid dehydratase/porphobilinogen synthase
MAGMASLSLRRTRLNRHVRELTRDVRLHEEQMIQPLFVVDGINQRQAIAGLDAVYRDSPETVLSQIDADLENGIAKFFEITTGIADDRNIVALTGLNPGDTVISGSFQTLRKLTDGEEVEIDEYSKENLDEITIDL